MDLRQSDLEAVGRIVGVERARQSRDAYQLGGPGSGPHPGGGSASHEKGAAVAKEAADKAAGNKFFRGKSESTHEDSASAHDAEQGAHAHLESRGLVKGETSAVFSNPGSHVTNFYRPDQMYGSDVIPSEKAHPHATVERGPRMDGKHYVNVKVESGKIK
jgi:hypothetical protein